VEVMPDASHEHTLSLVGALVRCHLYTHSWLVYISGSTFEQLRMTMKYIRIGLLIQVSQSRKGYQAVSERSLMIDA